MQEQKVKRLQKEKRKKLKINPKCGLHNHVQQVCHPHGYTHEIMQVNPPHVGDIPHVYVHVDPAPHVSSHVSHVDEHVSQVAPQVLGQVLPHVGPLQVLGQVFSHVGSMHVPSHVLPEVISRSVPPQHPELS